MHLVYHVKDLNFDKPQEKVRRAATVLGHIIGPAVTGGEAVEAVMRSVYSPNLVLSGTSRPVLMRVVVAWIGQGKEKGTYIYLSAVTHQADILSCLDDVMEAWTEAKYIRFALYAQQHGESCASCDG